MDSCEPALWAASGAMWLTAAPTGPPRVAPGSPALSAVRALQRVARATAERTGVVPTLPGVEVLGERAALSGLRPRWPWSCGAAFRFLPTRDGFLGVSLARDGDLDLLRALVADPGVTPENRWAALAGWARDQETVPAIERGRMLGLACAPYPARDRMAQCRPVAVRRGGLRRCRGATPLVVDLTALWAGPLCANLLGLGGAEIVKVESVQRPDGARIGSPALFELLHRGHRTIVLDFRNPADLDRLRTLVSQADLVLEASRPRALAQLGVDAEEVVAGGTSWLSITARGRDSNTIGFGDDVAAEGGLVSWWDGMPVVCGDAIGDPLTGVVAAAAASESLLSDRAHLIEVSMVDVCREAAAGATEEHSVVREGGRWWVHTGSARYPVLRPHTRADVSTGGRG
jgi:hypothetical protein